MLAKNAEVKNLSNLIAISNLYKIYNPGKNQVNALNGVTMAIQPGEFAAIIGHSGSGKSTLMNIIGCLDTPDNGTYYLNETDVSSLSDKELSVIRSKEIGFVFQSFHLLHNLTALENVELPLKYRGFRKEKRHIMALAALDQVGLANRLHHYPYQLSGGQQQRVAIARAIAASPPILLADEPTGNLDSKSGKEIMQIISTLWQNGTTIILITHDNQIAQTAKHIIKISDGEIIENTYR